MASGNARAQASGQASRPRAPQRERGRVRVSALLAAAAALFAEKGYEATTMTEIAARAGASIGTLYLFFPSKDVLAQTILSETAEDLSAQLDALHARTAGLSAVAIADALFAEIGSFLAKNPVYSILLDLPGHERWRRPVRARRRQQIAALFAEARPALAAEKAERLAVIVPQLMRIALTLDARDKLRDGILEELRLMLRHHLTAASAE
ncbi:TetR family transcriptional regulator [Methylovirgula ligni]|uniref:TetR family transcriptional regulator n=1 Tax=Methylovirgula ligni TaxID=569860 RepID=A0A3D9Z1M0_9HYPH|nr:TetR/AcrR family transcriptional regulator [Methylovirgula ligni]REF89074.1 TetR family transcriptional regulator [Methylovirgula ligni]